MAEYRNDDKRGFHRIIYHTDAFAYSGDTFTPCKVLDISFRGCLLELPSNWHSRANSVEHIKILLDGGLVIHMQVSLSHVEESVVGYRCEHIDLDSMTVLRRMIELNLGDSDLLERDIRALVRPSVFPR